MTTQGEEEYEAEKVAALRRVVALAITRYGQDARLIRVHESAPENENQYFHICVEPEKGDALEQAGLDAMAGIVSMLHQPASGRSRIYSRNYYNEEAQARYDMWDRIIIRLAGEPDPDEERMYW